MHVYEMHAYGMHAYEMHAYMHADEMHAYEIHARERGTPIRDMRPREMHAREMHACQIHTYKRCTNFISSDKILYYQEQFVVVVLFIALILAERTIPFKRYPQPLPQCLQPFKGPTSSFERLQQRAKLSDTQSGSSQLHACLAPAFAGSMSSTIGSPLMDYTPSRPDWGKLEAYLLNVDRQESSQSWMLCDG